MANFISKLFNKTEKSDNDKLVLQAHICLQNTILDKHLIALAVEQDRLQVLEKVLSLTTLTDEINLRNVHEEIVLLKEYIAAYKALKGEELYITLQEKVEELSDYKIYPFMLIPLIQNAVLHGYTTMEKYPIRIKLNNIGNSLKMEVSNRVNHYIQNQEDTVLMENFKARLDLLYPNRYNLIMNSNSTTFKATLLLN